MTLNEVLGDKLCWSPTFEVIDMLSDVEVIFGRDIPTQEVFLVYGQNRLQQLQNDDPDCEIDVLIVDLVRDSTELDKLLALVQLAKQSYDYIEAA